MCSGYCLEMLPSLKAPLSTCRRLTADRRTFYSGVWLVLVWGRSTQRAPWCSGLTCGWRVGAQVWYPGTSWLRGLLHLCQAEGAIFPGAIPRWFNRSANKYLLVQQCSRGGWQLARASGIDGDQRGFPQDDCKDTLPLESDCAPALCRAYRFPVQHSTRLAWALRSSQLP